MEPEFEIVEVWPSVLEELSINFALVLSLATDLARPCGHSFPRLRRLSCIWFGLERCEGFSRTCARHRFSRGAWQAPLPSRVRVQGCPGEVEEGQGVPLAVVHAQLLKRY